jgi:Na+/citrate or Na+/malate symporter
MVGLIIAITLSTAIAILWVRGISNMKEKYPDYKGEDFLADWDDDKVHTEDIY